MIILVLEMERVQNDNFPKNLRSLCYIHPRIHILKDYNIFLYILAVGMRLVMAKSAKAQPLRVAFSAKEMEKESLIHTQDIALRNNHIHKRQIHPNQSHHQDRSAHSSPHIGSNLENIFQEAMLLGCTKFPLVHSHKDKIFLSSLIHRFYKSAELS